MVSVVYILGLPGAGKGTQSAIIAQRHGYYHVNVGQLIRTALRSTTSCKDPAIQQSLAQGGLIPTATTCALMLEEMRSNPTAIGYIIDGFPRSMANLNGWATISSSLPTPPTVLGALVLQLDENTCIERCLSRQTDRTDDTVAMLQRRMTNYRLETQPVVDHLTAHNSLRIVDGTGTTSVVYTRMEAALRDLNADIANELLQHT